MVTKVVLMQVKRPEIVTRLERRGQARKRSKASIISGHR